MNYYEATRKVRSWGGKTGLGTALAGLQTLFQRAAMTRRHAPVVLQLSALECGAACLAMILSYYGRKTRVAECREYLESGEDGVTAQTIARAARRSGLRVKAYSLEPADFKHLRLPAIAHWNFNHFVVVERWSAKMVDIIDPALGRRQLTPAEFDAGFTGVVLTFEPDVKFERRQSAAGSAWLGYLKGALSIPGARSFLAQILGASLLLQILGLALPVFTKVIVDQVLPFQISNVMMILGVGIVILALAQVVTSYLRAKLLLHLQTRFDWHMMLGFFGHMLTLPYRFFQQRSSGDLIMRVGSNAIIREALTSQTAGAVLDGSLVLVYLGILLALEPVFGLIILGLGLLQVGLLLVTTRRMRRLMQRDLFIQAESQSYLVEALAGIATLKASGAEDKALDRWSDLFVKELNISLERNHLSAIIDTGITALRTFSSLILLWVGTMYVLNGTMSLGTMLAINALAVSFLTPLASPVTAGQQLQLVSAHLDRLTDVLEAEPEQSLEAAQNTPRLTGRIELKGVSFKYSPDSPLVLRDISVAIEPGQKVALVGPTASGKSTLASLLLGLYTPTEGEILYDGIPLQNLDYRALRSQFGVVLQEPFLFSGSVRQNIAFSDPSLSLEQVANAAQLAAIHNEIMEMLMGYETVVAEGGARLSGGQRQRLSLARALAHKPAVLLLDEATSHLDVTTESIVDQNLSSLSCTRIVIAHRLSTIRNADLILVLDQGTIVERGCHEELLAQGGHYAQLARHQLESEAPRQLGEIAW